MNFERAINKWRTSTDSDIFFEGKDGLSVATMVVNESTITILSDAKYKGEPCRIYPDDLKAFSRVDDLELIEFDGETLKWIGDVTVSVKVFGDDHIKPVDVFTPTNTIEWENLEFVLRAASTDPTRPVLTTVCFEPDKIVATDGFRLHWQDVQTGGLVSNGQYPCLVDRYVLDKIKTDINIKFEPDKALISYESYGTTVLIDTKYVFGAFPDWRQIVPDEHKHKVTLPGDKRFKKVAKDDKIKIFGNEVSTMYNPITTFEIDGLEMPIEIIVKPAYLIDTTSSEDSVLTLSSPTTPIMINTTAIIMPMKA